MLTSVQVDSMYSNFSDGSEQFIRQVGGITVVQSYQFESQAIRTPQADNGSSTYSLLQP